MKTKVSLIFVALLFLAACGPRVAATPTPTGASSSSPVTEGTTVTIASFAYNPASITVAVGATVTWTNNDSVAHTVTADDDSWGSEHLNQGGTYTHTFTEAGTYPYHCQFHPNMKGTVVVVAQ